MAALDGARARRPLLVFLWQEEEEDKEAEENDEAKQTFPMPYVILFLPAMYVAILTVSALTAWTSFLRAPRFWQSLVVSALPVEHLDNWFWEMTSRCLRIAARCSRAAGSGADC